MALLLKIHLKVNITADPHYNWTRCYQVQYEIIELRNCFRIVISRPKSESYFVKDENINTKIKKKPQRSVCKYKNISSFRTMGSLMYTIKTALWLLQIQLNLHFTNSRGLIQYLLYALTFSTDHLTQYFDIAPTPTLPIYRQCITQGT